MEPIVHFAVPFSALVSAGVKPKKAFLASLFSLLPDFDALFLVHRSFSHSLFVVMCTALPFMVIAIKLGYTRFSLMALLALLSHPVLDLFSGYTPILWPLCERSFWIKTELGFHIGSSVKLIPSFELLSEPTVFQHFQELDAPLFTGDGLIISIILLLPSLLNTSINKLQKKPRYSSKGHFCKRILRSSC
jgi:membrane-bound metal-dependent hydrolase YbcI (DUF457 family)